jgi:hypothetical protein
MFNSVADFKRQIQLGAKLHCTYHQAFAGRDENGEALYKDEDKGIREVSIVQTNSFALKTTKTDGKVVDSWCGYPKASQCKFSDDGKIIIMEPDGRGRNDDPKPWIPILTYTLVK